MAPLVIDATSVASEAGGFLPVSVALTDRRGTPVSGFTLTNAVFVLPSLASTDITGSVTLNLVPNSDIVQPDTYYAITIGARTVMILKTVDSQTLPEAAALVE